MNTSCSFCVTAEANPFRGGVFDESCKSCVARHIAQSPAGFRAINGDFDDLIAAIRPIWKDDLEAGRLAVWEWMLKMRAFAKARDSP